MLVHCKKLQRSLFLVLGLLFLPCGAAVARPEENAFSSKNDPDLVVLSYNSVHEPQETLIFSSLTQNQHDFTGIKALNVGAGQHLWVKGDEDDDNDDPNERNQRGWMYRLRLTLQAVVDEYHARGNEDFIVLIADAWDVYVTGSLEANALNELKRRFIEDFSEYQIVFSAQVYCCNPWELRSVAVKSWEEMYEKKGGVQDLNKYMNAGLFMGYASALVEMAEEMQLWEKTYQSRESFLDLIHSDSLKTLQMGDIDVDDDEWQLAAWYFKDQERAKPFATLDTKEDLFAITGTFRAKQDNGGFLVYSREEFKDMYGTFPTSFNPEKDLDKLVVCPYEYDTQARKWTSSVTGGSPLVFHFAGDDWLCACKVFSDEAFLTVPKHFRASCQYEYSDWNAVVQQAVQYVANVADANEEVFIFEVDENSSPRMLTQGVQLNENSREQHTETTSKVEHGALRGNQVQRNLKDPCRRRRKRNDDGPYHQRQLRDEGESADDHDLRMLKCGRRKRNDDGPYHQRNLLTSDKADAEADHDETLRMLKCGRRRRKRNDDGPYHQRQLGEVDSADLDELRMLKCGRHRRKRNDDGPYHQRNLLSSNHADDEDTTEADNDEVLRMLKCGRRRRKRNDDGPYHQRQLGEVDSAALDELRMLKCGRRKRNDDGPYHQRNLLSSNHADDEDTEADNDEVLRMLKCGRRRRKRNDDGPYHQRQLGEVDSAALDELRMLKCGRRKRNDDGPYHQRKLVGAP